MIENLTDYMKKITLQEKNLAEYKDVEKGIAYSIPLGHLIPRLDYLELTEDELKIKLFEQKIEKDIKFNKKEAIRPYLKYNDTQKEEDKSVIVDKKFVVNQIWNVSNVLGIYKTFNNKNEAINYYNELRKFIVNTIK